jgi:transcriptional regulator MraZ
VFSGNFHHVVDSKGRVSVPSAFRDLIQGSGSPSLFVTRHPLSAPRCLEAYPHAAWEEFKDKLLKLNRFDPNVFKLETLFVGSAHRCDIDGQGRILIPPTLREWANLGKEVVFVGATDRFRIFDRGAWDEAQEDAASTFKANPDLLARLNL